MYIVTHNGQPIPVIRLLEIERVAPDNMVEIQSCTVIDGKYYITFGARHACMKKFFRIVGHPWNQRNKSITLHKRMKDGTLVDVTSTGEWRERKANPVGQSREELKAHADNLGKHILELQDKLQKTNRKLYGP